jgi:predicted RND superfamily exporter protein
VVSVVSIVVGVGVSDKVHIPAKFREQFTDTYSVSSHGVLQT